MKYATIALLLAFSVTDANAVVYCAAGVYRAGCVARPVGAVVVAPRRVVVAPGCHWVYVAGVRVCR